MQVLHRCIGMIRASRLPLAHKLHIVLFFFVARSFSVLATCLLTVVCLPLLLLFTLTQVRVNTPRHPCSPWCVYPSHAGAHTPPAGAYTPPRLLQAADHEDARRVLLDATELKVVPLLQAFLFDLPSLREG